MRIGVALNLPFAVRGCAVESGHVSVTLSYIRWMGLWLYDRAVGGVNLVDGGRACRCACGVGAVRIDFGAAC